MYMVLFFVCSVYIKLDVTRFIFLNNYPMILGAFFQTGICLNWMATHKDNKINKQIICFLMHTPVERNWKPKSYIKKNPATSI